MCIIYKHLIITVCTYNKNSNNDSYHRLSIYYILALFWGLPRWLSGKESTCQCRRHGLTPGSIQEQSPGEGNGSPIQYSGQENPMDRGAWWATVHRVSKELATTKLNTIKTTPALFTHFTSSDSFNSYTSTVRQVLFLSSLHRQEFKSV